MLQLKTIYKQEETELRCTGIPFDDIVSAISSMKYGSIERVMFQMLVLTGCRVSELDNMLKSSIKGDVVFWKLGKNQKGWRNEKLGWKYIEELIKYRNSNRVYGNRLFGIHSHTFRQYFDKKVRKYLSAAWNEKVDDPNYNLHRERYRYQLKGIRKDFQTLEFAKQYKKWKDGYIAMEFTSKRMRHKSTKVTAYHYVENFEPLQIDNYVHMTPFEIISKNTTQRRIIEWV